MTAIRTEIQAFLKHTPVVCDALPHVRKAGVVPFMRTPLRYCVMTPVASKPDLGLPEFQLCKGTRMYQHACGQWRDMRGAVPEEAVLESLPEAALREGVEELGLQISNIAQLIPLGAYSFTSATNRKDVLLWLCAAEMRNAEAFMPLDALTNTTAARAWMDRSEFSKQGRPDHAHILSLIEEKLLGIVGA